MLTASSKIMKYLLFIFNLVFVLTGISLITIGLIITSDFAEYHPVAKDDYISASHLLIFTGGFIFVVSFFGCCGAIRENHLMLFTFSVIMAAIFVVEIVIGVSGYMLKGEVTDVLTDTLTQSMAKYNNDSSETKMWDNIQEQLLCCGTKNYTDWKNYTGEVLPTSCCSSVEEKAKVCNYNSANLHKTPCIDTLGNIFMGFLSVIEFTGIFIAAIQLLGVIFSCTLAYSIRHGYETV